MYIGARRKYSLQWLQCPFSSKAILGSLVSMMQRVHIWYVLFEISSAIIFVRVGYRSSTVFPTLLSGNNCPKPAAGCRRDRSLQSYHKVAALPKKAGWNQNRTKALFFQR